MRKNSSHRSDASPGQKGPAEKGKLVTIGSEPDMCHQRNCRTYLTEGIVVHARQHGNHLRESRSLVDYQWCRGYALFRFPNNAIRDTGDFAYERKRHL